ncbi:MAG: hypothetical protein ACREKE_04525 [bacterium]
MLKKLDEVNFKLGPIEFTALGSIARQALYLFSFVALTCAGVYFTDSRIIARLDRMDSEIRSIERVLKIPAQTTVGSRAASTQLADR